jgi:hypothetical protein
MALMISEIGSFNGAMRTPDVNVTTSREALYRFVDAQDPAWYWDRSRPLIALGGSDQRAQADDCNQDRSLFLILHWRQVIAFYQCKIGVGRFVQ